MTNLTATVPPISADPEGRWLARWLSTESGHDKATHWGKCVREVIARTPAGRDISLRWAWEMARSTYTGPDDGEGDFAWNVNYLPFLSRLAIFINPSLRGRISYRGAGITAAWNDPTLPMPACPFPWFDKAHPFVPHDPVWFFDEDRPVGAYAEVA